MGEPRGRTPEPDRAPEWEADLFAPGLLHELRQPLTGIEAAILLLERGLGTALSANGDWTLLKAQVERLGEIVRGYDALLRPGSAEPSAFAVEPEVARAVELLAHRVRPLGRRFSFPGGSIHRGFGAPGAVVHAATNLLANAVDALEGAVADARILVRVLGAAARVEVRVSDEGTGIAEDVRQHIFEPRFTTKAPGRGTGLGLHLARRLMAQYGGTVSLVEDGDPRRAPWAVTEFCIGLPAPPGGGHP
ncbi:MAG TPA: HAMP domain-containing sensor histidine kinase [Anaeromyxobacteraceae bacterium]|nr:HAMP domain-containing sensor histidine kinase [Anaeromyxobacteraceae bacterium]